MARASATTSGRSARVRPRRVTSGRSGVMAGTLRSAPVRGPGDRAQPAYGHLGAGAVGLLDAQQRDHGAVGPLETGPGGAGPHPYRRDVAPVELAGAVAVDHREPVGPDVDPGPGDRVAGGQDQSAQDEQGADLEGR